MRPWICGVAAALMVISTAQADEQTLTTRVESVGLFKNGLAVIRRTADLPGGGTFRIDDVPSPVHGTFWIESTTPVAARTTMRAVEVAAQAGKPLDLQEALVGKAVRLHLREPGLPAVVGKVVALSRPTGNAAWNRTYEQPQYVYYGWDGRGQQVSHGRFLVLEGENGRTLVDESMIAMVHLDDAGQTITQRRPVLLLEVDPQLKEPTTVTISYLTKGIAWAPDYRVNLKDRTRLSIEQHAVVKNELTDLAGTELRLISGFPSVEFGHVTSPLSQETNWAQFFQQLMTDPSQGHASSGNVLRQQVAMNSRNHDGDGGGLPVMPEGEGVDLHYQSIGQRTMAEGDALALTVASAEADYERIVEWVVPDTRTATGRHIDEYQRRNKPDQYEDAAWDAVRFNNPLPFPMTTGPAMVTSNGRFNGQQMATWTDVGEETTLKITKALSIRTRATEHEEQGDAARSIVYVGGNDYRKVEAKGELHVTNHRKEDVKLIIRRQFSGELKQADGDPKLSLREEGIWSVNRRNELSWTLTLKPGDERKLVYTYSVLVDH